MSVNAALQGTYGMQAVIDDNTDIRVRDDTPSDEKEYRSRFYFNRNDLAMSANDAFILFKAFNDAGSGVYAIKISANTSGQIRASMITYLDGGGTADTSIGLTQLKSVDCVCAGSACISTLQHSPVRRNCCDKKTFAR